MFNAFPINFHFDGKTYKGEIKPLQTGLQHRIPISFQVFLNNVYFGLVKRRGADWETDSPKCAFMVEVIGNHIYDWYEQTALDLDTLDHICGDGISFIPGMYSLTGLRGRDGAFLLNCQLSDFEVRSLASVFYRPLLPKTGGRDEQNINNSIAVLLGLSQFEKFVHLRPSLENKIMITPADKTVLKQFGDHLRKLRKDKGLSLREMSYACSIDNSKIAKIEKGMINITLTTLLQLAVALEAHPTVLLEYPKE